MDFVKKVNEGQEEFGGIPFWSWNDKLEEKELRRQINVMKELGMKGYFMHARGGLETEYLSDDWYNCVKACVDEGKKLGMESWAYDENGWPSGFGGGRLLNDPWNFATYLSFGETKEFPELSENEPPKKRALAVFVKDGNGFKRVTEAPNVYADNFFVVYQEYNNAYVDVLDKTIIKKFIESTHEEYKEKLGDDFGKAMPGFFTDEPQYYRYKTPWSNKMPEEFESRYGYSVYDKLIALFFDFDGADEFRYDYWYLCHILFMDSFAKQIYDWCDANGAKLTGHAVEESALFTQMWCCGGVMPFYEFEHMPGMDYLGRAVSNDLAPKQLGSVAAQLGKKKVLTETFACCGWDVTPRELKKIADIQYASGVNVMCHHLYAYSIRGQRKRDYPANYSEHLPWQNAFGDFVKYYDRLGFTLSMGKEDVKTLIIHPIHSDYLTYKRDSDRGSVAEIEDGVNAIISYFGDRQLSYHFGDEQIMSRHAKVCGDKIIVGNMTYDYVVLPRIKTLDGNTVRLLKEFLNNGGKLYMFDGKPTRIDGRISDMSWLKDTTTLADIEKDTFVSARNSKGEVLSGIKAMVRTTEFGKLYYLTNVYGNDYSDVVVKFNGVDKLTEVFLEEGDWKNGNALRAADCEKTAEGCAVKTSFESGKSRIFVENTQMYVDSGSRSHSAEEPNQHHLSVCQKLDGKYKLTDEVENKLTLDYAKISKDGGKTFEESKPIIQIFDELLRSRYEGLLTMQYAFNVKDVPEKLKVAMEPLSYKYVKINGKEVPFTGEWWLDRSFKVCDIAKNTVKGENIIEVAFDYFQDPYVYEVLYNGTMESVRNCLNFNTEVESMYIYGDFSVSTENEKFTPSERNSFIYSGDFSLAAPKKEIDISNVVLEGLPYYAGKLELEKEFELKEGQEELWLEGRFSYADVTINGKFVKRLMFTNHCDIRDFVVPGKNTLKLTLCNSNRNLLGPHHFADPEPYALGPVQFSLENMWHDGKCDLFRKDPSFVRFGVEVYLK